MENKFTKNLKRIMFEKNITQKELAEKLNTTQSFISTYQTGARNPKPETVEKIAKALGVYAKDLTEDKDETENKNIEDSDIKQFMNLKFKNIEEEILKLKKQFGTKLIKLEKEITEIKNSSRRQPR